MKVTVKKLVFAAVLASLTCIATMVIKVPSILQGYLNLGDGVVILTGWLLTPGLGFLSAAVGSALADVLSGYLVYAPVTFLIKGLMAVTAGVGFRWLLNKIGNIPGRIVSSLSAELLMILGYYVFEGFLYGFIPSAVNILPNAVQGIAGMILGLVLIQIFEKQNIKMQ
ncbi:MAG: ECF transporter S component [Clostridia bacterium]|nr:ECF transporter S component [Clostridia bacterium]